MALTGVTQCPSRNRTLWICYDDDDTTAPHRGTSWLREVNPATCTILREFPVEVRIAELAGSHALADLGCNELLTVDRDAGHQLIAICLPKASDPNPVALVSRRFSLFHDPIDMALVDGGNDIVYCDGPYLKVWSLVDDQFLRNVKRWSTNVRQPVVLTDSSCLLFTGPFLGHGDIIRITPKGVMVVPAPYTYDHSLAPTEGVYDITGDLLTDVCACGDAGEGRLFIALDWDDSDVAEQPAMLTLDLLTGEFLALTPLEELGADPDVAASLVILTRGGANGSGYDAVGEELTIECPEDTGTVGEPYSSSVTASGGTEPYTFAIAGDLPAGYTFDPATGLLTFTADAPNTYAFTVSVTDAAEATAATSCSITIDFGPCDEDCGPPGPGGSSFDGSPDGERRVAPGGYPATYVPPVGEGETAQAADPTDPQDLATLETPLVSLDITLCDESIVRLAQGTLPRIGLPQMQPVVLRFGRLLYPYADRFGALKAQTWEVEIADPSGFFRGLLAGGANRFYKRWLADAYVEDDQARLAGLPRQRLARGRCVTIDLGSTDQTLVFVFTDDYSRHDSPYSLDRMVPHVLIRDIFRPGATSPDLAAVPQPSEEISSLATLILPGECSDEFRAAENPPITPIGICKVFLLGDVEIDGETWQMYLICLYASYGIPALFGSNLDRCCPQSVRLDPALYDGTDDPQFLVPGYAPWDDVFDHKYIEVTANHKTYWVTAIFGRGEISQQHVDGKVPLSVNVNGLEDVGDGTGLLIDDISRQLQLLIDHPILRRTTSGVWGDVARYPDGIAKIRTSDTERVRAIHNARLHERYRSAPIIDTQRAAKDWIADLCVSGDIRIGLNHHGQITMDTLNLTPTFIGLRTFTDLRHIVEDSFKLTSELNAQLENKLVFDGGPEPASGRTTLAKHTVTSDGSITDWGDTYEAQPITFVALRRIHVAASVAAYRIHWTREGITEGTFDVNLAGGTLTGGELVQVTHFAGIGQTGWCRRVLKVGDRELFINDTELRTRVHWEDADPMLVLSGTGGCDPAIPAASRIGFHPLGSSVLNTATRLGSSAAGTAHLLG